MPAATDLCSELKGQFPALHQDVRGRSLAYLDNAATTQRPERVLAAMESFYREDNANVHRGVHLLSQRATDRFDAARAVVADFVGAASPNEIIFTKGCTEALNLVAQGWGRTNLKPGDTVLLSTMEHHANIVPWQLAGAKTIPIPISDEGVLDLHALERLLEEHRPKAVGVKHVCNALGTVNPIAEVVRLAHTYGAVAVVDGAQGLAHQEVNVQQLGVDFYAMASHKTYGPMGVGALYAKRELLESMSPWQGGGDMIRTVAFEETTFNTIPNKFEPGTPNVPGVIGFAEALLFLREVGLDRIQSHERDLTARATQMLLEVPGLRLVGTAPGKAGILSVTLDGVHPHDLGTILDQHGVAVRTGHHCCMPLMRRLGLPATARASLALYNGIHDIEALIAALHAARKIFS